MSEMGSQKQEGDEKDFLFCPVCERKTKSCYSKKYKGKSELFHKKNLYQCLECKHKWREY